MYIGMADAYGAACEYLRPGEGTVRDACLSFQGYLAHPRHGNPKGCYTDDTEMSAGNIHVLLEEAPYTKAMFADAWVREFIRGGQRKGYSRGFQSILESVSSGEELLANLYPRSNKNGAAMRAVPFGVLPTVEEVLAVAELQACITHDTPEGRFSARAAALMSHWALYKDRSWQDLPAYCLKHLPPEDIAQFGYIFRRRWSGQKVRHALRTSVAVATVHAVVDLLVHQPSLTEMLRQIILWGGDTDSVAAITWGIASSRYQQEVLPAFLERDLEEGSALTGAAYLCDLSARLMEKFA